MGMYNPLEPKTQESPHPLPLVRAAPQDPGRKVGQGRTGESWQCRWARLVKVGEWRRWTKRSPFKLALWVPRGGQRPLNLQAWKPPGGLMLLGKKGKSPALGGRVRKQPTAHLTMLEEKQPLPLGEGQKSSCPQPTAHVDCSVEGKGRKPSPTPSAGDDTG